MKSSKIQKKPTNFNTKAQNPSYNHSKEDSLLSQSKNPFLSQSKESKNPFFDENIKPQNPFFNENIKPQNPFLGSQTTSLHSPSFSTSQSVVQKKSPKSEGNSLSLEEAKKIILKSTSGIGTDEDAIYDAIRRCEVRERLKYDAEVIGALNGDLDGHELWKCHLLIEYGSESKFPSPIIKLWTATAGAGTDEETIFAALESMDKRAKTSYGLKYILRTELSGSDLQKALDLIIVSDTISKNIYGSQIKGEEKLIVNKNNLRPLIDSQFVGGASEGLKNAMIILYSKPGGSVLTDALARIESIRGMALGSALAQYNTAMQKQEAGIEHYKKEKNGTKEKYNHLKDNPSPALDTSEHEDFTASNAQLRFGKIVGDVFGIDAVFGSLISPTGGMAGPGNDRIPILKDGGAVATHGAIHDAAGYLYNCHGIGSGYDYLQSEPGSDPKNPLAGQTNMQWWINEFDKTDNDVQLLERFLNSNAHIGAAFSKQYDKLNTAQKKNALKVMSETSSFVLSQGGISNSKRIEKISELMNSCSAAEKTILADYFYNYDGFGNISGVHNLMKPHVSEQVYKDYTYRIVIKSSI
jgi:hypothetical protein